MYHLLPSYLSTTDSGKDIVLTCLCVCFRFKLQISSDFYQTFRKDTLNMFLVPIGYIKVMAKSIKVVKIEIPKNDYVQDL